MKFCKLSFGQNKLSQFRSFQNMTKRKRESLSRLCELGDASLISKWLSNCDLLQLCQSSINLQAYYFPGYAMRIFWHVGLDQRAYTLPLIRKIHLDAWPKNGWPKKKPSPFPNPVQIKEIKMDAHNYSGNEYLQLCTNLTKLELVSSSTFYEWIDGLSAFSKLEELTIQAQTRRVSGRWPLVFKTLIYHGNFDAGLPKLPDGLVKLELGSIRVPRQNWFPQSLQDLSIGTAQFPYVYPLSLPNNLTKLRLYCDQALVIPGVLPKSLTSLVLVNTCERPGILCKNALGSSLLSLSYYSSHGMFLDNLPQSLTALRVQLGGSFSDPNAHSIEGHKFPPRLVKLVLYNALPFRPLAETFPVGLQTLKLYCDAYSEFVADLRPVCPRSLTKVGFFTHRPSAIVVGQKSLIKPHCNWLSFE
jgi:hypothetical protein